MNASLLDVACHGACKGGSWKLYDPTKGPACALRASVGDSRHSGACTCGKTTSGMPVLEFFKQTESRHTYVLYDIMKLSWAGHVPLCVGLR